MTTETDQRMRRVELTAAGRAAAAKALPAWQRAHASVAPILRRWKLENLLKAKA